MHHVIVRAFDNVAPRLPIETFAYHPNYKRQRDLFLQSYSIIQERNYSDPTSYFAIAGIHGLPYVAYDVFDWEDEPSTNWDGDQGRWGGFCHHGDVLFPTWHRPYVLLMENVLVDTAKEIVDSYDPTLPETAEYKKACETLRLPYWDWASPTTATKGMPQIVFEEYVYVDTPSVKNKRIRNPLYSFLIPQDVSPDYMKRDMVKRKSKRSANTTTTTSSSSSSTVAYSATVASSSTYSAVVTTATTNSSVIYSAAIATNSSVAYYTSATVSAIYTTPTYNATNITTPKNCTRKKKHHHHNSGRSPMLTLNATIRHPDSYSLSNMTDTNQEVMILSTSVFRPTVFQMLLNQGWREFSNHGDGEAKVGENIGHFASLEIVHDAVHDAVGGTGGHMAYTDTAAFDPIFFLHHANVDRMFAIYQMCHPDVWIEPSSDTEGTYTVQRHETLDENSPLTPFRKNETAYWTSKDVRNVSDLGYTYPDLLNYRPPAKMLMDMLNYYNAEEEYLRYHYSVTMSILKHKAGTPFQIRVFVDKPDADASTPITDPHFAGLVSVFARDQSDNLDDKQSVVTGSVDLTSCMRRLSIFMIEMSFPSSPILSDQITFVAVRKDGKQISLSDAGLLSVDYWTTDQKNPTAPATWVTEHLGILYPTDDGSKSEPVQAISTSAPTTTPTPVTPTPEEDCY